MRGYLSKDLKKEKEQTLRIWGGVGEGRMFQVESPEAETLGVLEE